MGEKGQDQKGKEGGDDEQSGAHKAEGGEKNKELSYQTRAGFTWEKEQAVSFPSYLNRPSEERKKAG